MKCWLVYVIITSLYLFCVCVRMRLIILESYDKVSEWAARYIKKRIRDFQPGPDRFFTLGLPTGQ